MSKSTVLFSEDDGQECSECGGSFEMHLSNPAGLYYVKTVRGIAEYTAESSEIEMTSRVRYGICMSYKNDIM